jgi:anti-sigma factor RsiW
MRQGNRLVDADRECSFQEQDLLLYLHDAISARGRMRVESHVRHCRSCQKRLKAFAVASEALAGAVREDLHWTPPRKLAAVWRRSAPWYTPLLVVFLLGGVGLVCVQYGIWDWLRERAGGAPQAGFREKLLTHRHLIVPVPAKGKGGYCLTR